MDQPAAHLEDAGPRMVIVLDHDAGVNALRQQWPGMRRRRRYGLADDLMRALELCKIKHGRSSTMNGSRDPHPPSCPPRQVSSKHGRTRWNRNSAAYWIVRSSRTMTIEFVVAVLSSSHQRLAGSECRRRGLLLGLLGQQHF